MEANEAMKAMARRIADQVYGEHARGGSFHGAAEAGALAAIMKTQALDAALVDSLSPSAETCAEAAVQAGRDAEIAERIRAGEHYALAGDRPEPSNLHKAQNAPAHLLTPESDNAGI